MLITKTNKGFTATKTIIQTTTFVNTAHFLAENEEEVKQIIEKEGLGCEGRNNFGTIVKEEITINIEEDHD